MLLFRLHSWSTTNYTHIKFLTQYLQHAFVILYQFLTPQYQNTNSSSGHYIKISRFSNNWFCDSLDTDFRSVPAGNTLTELETHVVDRASFHICQSGDSNRSTECSVGDHLHLWVFRCVQPCLRHSFKSKAETAFQPHQIWRKKCINRADQYGIFGWYLGLFSH